MIRVSLSRVRTLGSGARRIPTSADTARPAPAELVLQGVLLVSALPDDRVVDTTPARSWEEAIDYDRCMVVLLEQPADDMRPRVWKSTPVRLIVASVSPDFVPLKVETQTSEYLVLVLAQGAVGS